MNEGRLGGWVVVSAGGAGPKCGRSTTLPPSNYHLTQNLSMKPQVTKTLILVSIDSQFPFPFFSGLSTGIQHTPKRVKFARRWWGICQIKQSAVTFGCESIRHSILQSCWTEWQIRFSMTVSVSPSFKWSAIKCLLTTSTPWQEDEEDDRACSRERLTKRYDKRVENGGGEGEESEKE